MVPSIIIYVVSCLKESGDTLCSFPRCMQPRKPPSRHSKEFYTYHQTTNGSFLMKAGLKLTWLSWPESCWTRRRERKWKSILKNFRSWQKCLLNLKGLHFFFFRRKKLYCKKKREELAAHTKKNNLRYMCCKIISQIRNQSAVLICWNSNTQLCFQLTPMWRFRTFFCAKVKMIKGRLK